MLVALAAKLGFAIGYLIGLGIVFGGIALAIYLVAFLFEGAGNAGKDWMEFSEEHNRRQRQEDIDRIMGRRR